MPVTRRNQIAKKGLAPRRSPCPVACSLDIFGDRWTLLVIRDLFFGRTRFKDFAASPEGIPTNILTQRLERLMARGIITIPLKMARARLHRRTERKRHGSTSKARRHGSACKKINARQNTARFLIETRRVPACSLLPSSLMPVRSQTRRGELVPSMSRVPHAPFFLLLPSYFLRGSTTPCDRSAVSQMFSPVFRCNDSLVAPDARLSALALHLPMPRATGSAERRPTGNRTPSFPSPLLLLAACL